MTNDELRALADCLDDPNAMQRTARRKAADYLRAQADAQPVATLTLLDDMGIQIDFRKSFTLLPGQTFFLYTHPAPAAPPAEPQNIRERWNIERQSDGSLLVCFNLHEKGEKCEYEHFVPARVQAEPKREPRPCTCHPDETQIEARDALLDFISENGTASEGVQHYLDRYVRAALAAQEQK